MNRTGLLSIVAVAIVLSVSVGVGFAVTYTATTVSNDNTMDYSGDLVDIVDRSTNLSIGSSIAITSPTVNVVDGVATVTRLTDTIPTYKLRVVADEGKDLVVHCYVILKDPRSWAIIERMTLAISDGQQDRTIDLIADRGDSGTQRDSSIPSIPLTLAAGDYPFTLTIVYANITLDLNGEENTNFADLSGSKIVFVAGESDPLP